MFKVAGLSRQNGSVKLRFANDFVSRVKVLQRNGHKDINLVELPQAMTKDAAVQYLSTLEQFAYIEAQAVFMDYTTKNVKTAPKAKTSKPKELEIEVELETDEQKAKRERDAARKRAARAAAKQTEVDHA